MSNQLTFDGGLFEFNQGNLAFTYDPKKWYQSGGYSFLIGLFFAVTMFFSANSKGDTARLVLSYILFFFVVCFGIIDLVDLINGKKTPNNDEIPVADIRKVKFKKTLFNNVRVTIYHGKNGFRMFRCHKKALEESGLIPFLQQLNIPITLP